MADEPKLEELDKLIAVGKQKGFLTYDEVNDALPQDIVSLDQLDDIMMMFGEMDIEVVDTAAKGAGRLPSEIETQAEADDDERGTPPSTSPGPGGRTEDPVRLYLREMGRVLDSPARARSRGQADREGKDEVTAHPSPQPGPREDSTSPGRAEKDVVPSRKWWTTRKRNSPRKRKRISARPSSASSATRIGCCGSGTSSWKRSRSSGPAPSARSAPRASPRGRSWSSRRWPSRRAYWARCGASRSSPRSWTRGDRTSRSS